MQRADDYNFAKGKIPFILETLRNNINKFTGKTIPLYLNDSKYKTYSSEKVGDYSLFSVKIDSTLKIEEIIFYTNDTKTAKSRIESEITSSLKEYVKKNKLNTKKGLFYIFEIYPYTNIVQPHLMKDKFN
ncbi:hypothetical protein EZ449_17235 [Pedobacter frigidisoli]|uniref:Uncharacterized protein n=1 Tax=Pedobacter frigidisoli TaxID=2530455 RepID=A0A4R0NWB4_9SPHI|nr:hypothetical protein [Pedobacter frigidisoli]TCD04383.1 hypothetical protein EZ449_17235 [Pedobacter frigidisoli]